MIFDYSDGNFIMPMGNSMGMDFDGNMHMRMGDNMSMDMETGNTVALNALEYKETYRRLSSDFCNRLKQRCGMYKMDYVEADIAKTFKEILAPYLLKRAVLH